MGLAFLAVLAGFTANILIDFITSIGSHLLWFMYVSDTLFRGS